MLVPSLVTHGARAPEECVVACSLNDLRALGDSALDRAQLRAAAHRVKPSLRHLGHLNLGGARRQLPPVGTARYVRRRRRDDVASLASHVDAGRERRRAVAHLHTLRHAEVDVSPARPGDSLDGIGQAPEALHYVVKAFLAAVPRVDVDDHEPVAGGDPDVGLGPLRPPRGDLRGVGGGVEAPPRRPRVLPWLCASARRRATRAGSVDDGVQGEHPPPKLKGIDGRCAPEARHFLRRLHDRLSPLSTDYHPHGRGLSLPWLRRRSARWPRSHRSAARGRATVFARAPRAPSPS